MLLGDLRRAASLRAPLHPAPMQSFLLSASTAVQKADIAAEACGSEAPVQGCPGAGSLKPAFVIPGKTCTGMAEAASAGGARAAAGYPAPEPWKGCPSLAPAPAPKRTAVKDKASSRRLQATSIARGLHWTHARGRSRHARA